jgi:hypothetical protein
MLPRRPVPAAPRDGAGLASGMDAQEVSELPRSSARPWGEGAAGGTIHLPSAGSERPYPPGADRGGLQCRKGSAGSRTPVDSADDPFSRKSVFSGAWLRLPSPGRDSVTAAAWTMRRSLGGRSEPPRLPWTRGRAPGWGVRSPKTAAGTVQPWRHGWTPMLKHAAAGGTTRHGQRMIVDPERPLESDVTARSPRTNDP